MRPALTIAMLIALAAAAISSPVGAESPHKDCQCDDNQGGGNDPNAKAPGQTNNPNPGK
jgi:hypothetical protein